ncbi:MAG: hypothetical protein JXQ87_03640 [Bacteroidia bacterium]
MKETKKAVWFKGDQKIECNINSLIKSISNLGTHYSGVTGLMKGITRAELVEQGIDFVTIKTNEGIMKRTGIKVQGDKEKVTVEFDEEYKAGKTITTNSHFKEEFNSTSSGITFSLEISNLAAPGLMGFFYRNFGNKNIGNAFLDSSRLYLENI